MEWYDRSRGKSWTNRRKEDVRIDISNKLINRVKRTIDKYHLLENDDRVVVGVSGGIDSMVLLYILNNLRKEYNLFLIVAHLNHGLRPEESITEAHLVREESEKFGLPFEYKELDVKKFQETEGLSLQDAARRLRFRFFEDLLLKYNANKIALGHNADDQVETVILRILRGTGLKGLKGMLPIRDGVIIRPLIEIWREDLESFAKVNDIPFVIDSSNLKEDYLRNKVRLKLIPLIEKEYQPKFKDIILKTANLLREVEDYIERKVGEVYREMVKIDQESYSFSFSKYKSLESIIQWRLIQRILENISPNNNIIKNIPNPAPIFKRLNKSQANLLYKIEPGILLGKRYDNVFLRKGEKEEVSPFEIEIRSPGKIFIKEIKKELFIEEVPKSGGFISDSTNIGFFDYNRLKFPLKVRNFKAGDRFQPLGLEGMQKLKKFFIDHKVPRSERSKIPLIVSEDIIAWVVGYRIDERVKVRPDTERVLKIQII